NRERLWRFCLKCFDDLIPRVDTAGASEFAELHRQQAQECLRVSPDLRPQQVGFESQQLLFNGLASHLCRIQCKRPSQTPWRANRRPDLPRAQPGPKLAAGRPQPMRLMVLLVELVPPIVVVVPVLELDVSGLDAPAL